MKKNRSNSPSKYLTLSRGRNTDVLTTAFTEYISKKTKEVEKAERLSVLTKPSQFKEMVKNAVMNRIERKELGQ